MAHAFQPIPGKPSFGNITPTQYAGDYTKNKLAHITYCRNSKNRNCKKRYSQGDLLRYYQGQTLSRYGFCNGISPLNYADLTAGLYTQSNLQNVAIISNVSGNLTPTTIDPCVCPFYSYYNIDPKGELFGNTECGLNNFTSYMTLDDSNILPPPPTDLSVTLLSSLSTSTSTNSASFMEPFTEPITATVTFSWQPPIYNGGSLISEYVVNYYDTADPETIDTDTVPSTQLYIEISNIQIPSITYTFKVASVNLTGQGPFAQIEYTSPTYPDAPTDAIATPSFDFFQNNIVLTWVAPTFAGGGGTTISYYDISYNDGTTTHSGIMVYVPTYSISIGLSDATTYTFQIYSVNSLELKSQTAADASATTFSTPSVPTNLSATPGNTEVTLTWNTPSSDGGSPIVYYDISYNDGNTPFDASVNYPDTTYTAINLTNGQQYTFQVAAVNIVGNSSYSTPPAQATPNVLPGQPYQSGSNWPHFGGTTNSNSRYSSIPGPTTPNLSWTQQLQSTYLNSSPSIDVSGNIYIGNGAYLYSVSTNGSVNWEINVNDINFSSPTIDNDGTIYIGDYLGTLYSVNPTDGSLNWTCFPGGTFQINSSPAISSNGETIYIGLGKAFYAINKDNGTTKWTCVVNGTIDMSSPAIDNSGNIYVGDNSGFLYSIKDNGVINWSALPTNPTSASISTPIISPNGLYIYIANTNGLYSISTSTGSIIWTYTGSFYAGLAVGPDAYIYIGDIGGTLYSITDTGTDASLNWSYLNPDDIVSSPVVDISGNIYYSTGNNIYAVNSSSQELLWKYGLNLGSGLTGSPSIDSSGNLYIGDGLGNLYSFSATIPTPPTVPQNFYAEITSFPPSYEAFISWDAPVSDGGSPITGYDIQYDTVPPSGQFDFGPQPGYSYVIGLSPGQYIFYIYAINNYGQSSQITCTASS